MFCKIGYFTFHQKINDFEVKNLILQKKFDFEVKKFNFEVKYLILS